MNFFETTITYYEWMTIIQVALLVVLVLMGLTNKQSQILVELKAIQYNTSKAAQDLNDIHGSLIINR